jgi:hypothetical protein
MPHTVGYWNHGTIPTEKKLITRDDPEYFATNNIIPSTGGVPVIDVRERAFQFQRSDYTFDVPGGVTLFNPQKERDQQYKRDERDFLKRV